MEMVISGIQQFPKSIKVSVKIFDEDPIDDMPAAAHYDIAGASVWVKGLTLNPDALTEAVSEAVEKATAFLADYEAASHEDRLRLKGRLWSIELDTKEAVKAAAAKALVS